MAVSFVIEDGSPIWASQSIIPSTTRPASPSTAPTEATIYATSTNVDVYVRVDNTGTAPVGCPTGAWAAPVAFTGLRPANPAGPISETHNGWTFTASTTGDSLVKPGVGTRTLPNPTSGRKCWGWSPDGRFFGFATEPTGGDGRGWNLLIVALENATRFGGTALVPLSTAYQYPSWPITVRFDTQFSQTTFSWVGNSAVFARGIQGTSPATTESRFVVCFRMATPATATDTVPDGNTWLYLASPCGSRIAFVLPPTATGLADLTWMSTTQAMAVSARANNVTLSPPVTPDGPAPTITTQAHTALGVDVNPGSGPIVKIDDPDSTTEFGGLLVHVDRVKASTLPSANLGVRTVGTAAAGPIASGASRWVQVPNTVGWDNQGESHWCLLAQAWESSENLARPWNGQATTPPPFPAATSDRCAQRNVHIL